MSLWKIAYNSILAETDITYLTVRRVMLLCIGFRRDKLTWYESVKQSNSILCIIIYTIISFASKIKPHPEIWYFYAYEA